MPAKKKSAAQDTEKETKATTKKAATSTKKSSKTEKSATGTGATKATTKTAELTEVKAAKATKSTTKKATSASAAKKTTKSETQAGEKKSTKTTATKKTAAAETKKTSTRATKTPAARKKAAESAVGERDQIRPVVEEAIHGSSPTEVREHFVESLHVPAEPSVPQRDLPSEYGDTKIVLLVRDPEWVFAYWEINDEARARYGIPRAGHGKRLVLRVYNVTGRNWPSENAQYFFDIDVGPYANNWYIRLPETDATWVGELGVFDDNGEYVPIVASNVVHTPRDSMSQETDEQWMVIEETFRKLYESSGGTRIRDGWRGSEELWRHLQKQILPSLAGAAQLGGSGAIMGSGGVAPVKQQGGPTAFWLQAETELILYGATEPTAKVTVNDEPVALRPDGSFTLRFALPDGTLKLVVRAVSADGQHERIITKEVRKLTK